MRVDPFVAPIPKKIQEDPELRPFFEYFIRWAHDIWLRTGGGVDVVEDTEVSLTTQDGGNRTNRYLRDEIDDLKGRIEEIRKPRDYTQEILDIINSQKRQTRQEVEQEPTIIKNTYLTEKYESLKRHTRTLEQKINELEERLDNGT